MLAHHGAFSSREDCWDTVVDVHREQFTQVREIDIRRASIRLPKGKLFVSVTERKDFDKIEERIPACVQTRLDEFLDRHGDDRHIKVYYLKPLCVEVDDKLVFTEWDEIEEAIRQIQDKVFATYRELYLPYRTAHYAAKATDLALVIPKSILTWFVERRRKAIATYQAKLEFNRRKMALRAAKTHRKVRTDGCTFDDMLKLTNPLRTDDVINQYAIENELSNRERNELLKMAAYETAGVLPWFMAASLTMYLVSTAWTAGSSVALCDPAFVAEMPGQQRGTLLKIGHFDEVDGVTHVEI